MAEEQRGNMPANEWWPRIARRAVAGLGVQPGELVQVRDQAGRPEVLVEILLAVERAGATPWLEIEPPAYVRRLVTEVDPAHLAQWDRHRGDLMGRIDHNKTGDQTGADIDRVHEALKHLELVYCEMEPGTALFFHANLLHRSDANRSPNPRWSLICCYNAARNPCKGRANHPEYSYLERWPDERIKEVGRRQLDAIAT